MHACIPAHAISSEHYEFWLGIIIWYGNGRYQLQVNMRYQDVQIVADVVADMQWLHHRFGPGLPNSLVSIQKQLGMELSSYNTPQHNLMGNTMLDTGIVYECVAGANNRQWMSDVS